MGKRSIGMASALTVGAGLVASVLIGATPGVSLARPAIHLGPRPMAARMTAPSVHARTFNIYRLAVGHAASARGVSARQMPLMPLRRGHTSARTSRVANAPMAASVLAVAGQTRSDRKFRGMADSASICPYFGGCQPPDMALATAPNYVLQGVNTSWQLYSPSGATIAGPITSQQFFQVPPLPGNCDPAGPFLSDPRAFYDPNTNLLWAATLQVESAAFGVGVNCPNQSVYWIANLNPRTGVEHVYSFDMTLGGTVNAGADYTQFGFSGKTIAVTGNMFDFTTGSFDFAEAQFASKAAMAAGLPVTPTAFTNLTVPGVNGPVFVDTVQPVETETTPANDPGVQYLVNSFNGNGDPNGNDCFFTACHGFVVWAYDPVTQGLSGSLVTVTTPNPAYISPPNADQPGCIQCVETLDNRISATPVYSVGGGRPLISFALETAVQNGGLVSPGIVPGILWGQIQVANGPGGFVTGSLYQSGYLAFNGDRAASFGAMMQDKNGNLVMVFDTMSSNLNPSIMVTSRSKSAPLGSLAAPKFLIKGPSPTFDSRWGDFEAASYDGFSSNHIWVASQYSVSGDWNTLIARIIP